MTKFNLKKAILENKATFHSSLTEGQFSWFTQDTNQQIGSENENTLPFVYMFDNKGMKWLEKNYEGYGVFGNKDYYELLDQMNGGTGDRSRGINLAFDKEPTESGKVLYPALVVNPNFNWKSHDFTEESENDPNQSWYQEPEEEDYNLEDDEDDDDEYLQEASADSTPYGNYINKARAKSHLTKKDGDVYGIDESGKGHKITDATDLDKYTKFTIKSKELNEGKEEVVLSNKILDFLEERGIIDPSDAQKVHKDLTTFLEDKVKSEELNEGKMYYHVLEDMGYGEIGHEGVYDTEEEAQDRANNLSRTYPDSSFYVEPSTSEEEPYNVTSSDYDPNLDIDEGKKETPIDEEIFGFPNVDINFPTLKTKYIAKKFAEYMSNKEGQRFTVTLNSPDGPSFDLDLDGEEYDGGSYLIAKNGDIINVALRERPVYGNISMLDETEKPKTKMKKLELKENSDSMKFDILYDFVDQKMVEGDDKAEALLKSKPSYDDLYDFVDQKMVEGDDEAESLLNKINKVNENKSSKIKMSELKAKIKEMVLLEMEKDINISDETPESEEDFLAEVNRILAEADEEVDVDDTEVAVDGKENIDVDTTVKVDPNVKAVQDSLTQAQAAAQKLGDPKLTDQIGNTITFFTRTHVVDKGAVAEADEMEEGKKESYSGKSDSDFNADIENQYKNYKAGTYDKLKNKEYYDDAESDDAAHINALEKDMKDDKDSSMKIKEVVFPMWQRIK
jgi:hypothetical protein